ncbi:unnamed protein product [Mesocestoides corti]|uniref:Uncharacterized protein n=1 Tax=Mesocestoides corti TaxID=53468 RepID=A0A0R3UMT8_MESCO|nr:unnamed protein product [Mesocestoides corti]
MLPFISQYRCPYSNTSIVDLPTATATSESSADTLRSCDDSPLLPSECFAPLSSNSGTRAQGTAPVEATSDANLDASAGLHLILVVVFGSVSSELFNHMIYPRSPTQIDYHLLKRSLRLLPRGTFPCSSPPPNPTVEGERPL